MSRHSQFHPVVIPSLSLGALVLAGCALAGYAGVGVAPEQAEVNRVTPDRAIDYNWDVKPILSENCFVCHGPGDQQAGLRLDDPEVASRVIVPGSPESSELVRRINSDNDFERMPASGSNKELTPDEIATLERWIAQGAEYRPHWAFITPARPDLPASQPSGRVENEVDRFVLERLAEVGLSPSEEADPETLINRVSLTLTGLSANAGRGGRVRERSESRSVRTDCRPAPGIGSLRRAHGTGMAGRSALCGHGWVPARFSQSLLLPVAGLGAFGV